MTAAAKQHLATYRLWMYAGSAHNYKGSVFIFVLFQLKYVFHFVICHIIEFSMTVKSILLHP